MGVCAVDRAPHSPKLHLLLSFADPSVGRIALMLHVVVDISHYVR